MNIWSFMIQCFTPVFFEWNHVKSTSIFLVSVFWYLYLFPMKTAFLIRIPGFQKINKFDHEIPIICMGFSWFPPESSQKTTPISRWKRQAAPEGWTRGGFRRGAFVEIFREKEDFSGFFFGGRIDDLMGNIMWDIVIFWSLSIYSWIHIQICYNIGS